MKFFAIGMLSVGFLFAFFGRIVSVAGGSMYPTLQNGDIVIVESLSPRLASLARGELLVLENPHARSLDEPLLIKRLIGLPTETVHMASSSITITRACDSSGAPIEPARSELISSCKNVYESNSVIGRDKNTEGFSMYLGSEDYLVLGDDRIDSMDSRYYGAMQMENFIGRAALRVWPLERFGALYGGVE